jgi:quercetin dioxygenase-like cupin family protein
LQPSGEEASVTSVVPNAWMRIRPEEATLNNLITHALSSCVALAVGASFTFAARGPNIPPSQPASAAETQAQVQAQQTLLFETTMEDVLGRVVAIREFERAPGTGGTPHRHPGSHTFGYVLEGTYEVQVDDGPLQRLGAGETFYERPGSLHAVSRNGSRTDVVRYLVITVSDPTLPATVPE